MKMKKKILWIYTKKSSFVQRDINLISEEFHISEFKFVNIPKIYTVISLIRLFFHLILNIKKYDLLITQFAGYQSLVPSLITVFFKKKSIIIVGGADCVGISSIKYGNFNKFLLSIVTKFSLKNCSHIIAVDDSLVFQKYTYIENIGNQGIKYFIPDMKTSYSVIHYGFDPEKWFRYKDPQPYSFLTVSAVDNVAHFYRKGIDLIIELAKKFPYCTFTIIGLDKNLVNSEIENLLNIHVVSFVNYDSLIEYYNNAMYYLQLSMMEGFPSAPCEAMLCECVPIVSNVAAMPQIVGDSGFILKHKDIYELVNLVQEALKSDWNVLSKKARNRIIENYPHTKRKRALLDVFTKLTLH